MKYVMIGDQIVNIEGEIDSSYTSHDGTYVNGDQKQLSADFLTFEHTDGLNYVNIGVRKHWAMCNFGAFYFNGFLGASGGVLLPKTNAQLLSKNRHDAVHFSGLGMALTGGAQLSYKNIVFVQGELKGGYINMGNVRTTNNKQDKMEHSFFYGQWNIVFGGSFRIKNKD